jgi:hypothetical protein
MRAEAAGELIHYKKPGGLKGAVDVYGGPKASLLKFSPLMCLSYHGFKIVCGCYFRENPKGKMNIKYY